MTALHGTSEVITYACRWANIEAYLSVHTFCIWVFPDSLQNYIQLFAVMN
jgi:hypothetical protein